MSRKIIIAPESKQNPRVEIDPSEPKQPSDIDETSPEHERALRRCEDRKKFVSISDQVAESTFYFRNYKYQNADKLWPNFLDVDQKFITKCYPYAKGGMLLVDEPTNEKQKALCLKKQEVLRKAGFRHIVLWVDPKEPEAIFYDCHKQLEEGEKIYVAHTPARPKN